MLNAAAVRRLHCGSRRLWQCNDQLRSTRELATATLQGAAVRRRTVATDGSCSRIMRELLSSKTFVSCHSKTRPLLAPALAPVLQIVRTEDRTPASVMQAEAEWIFPQTLAAFITQFRNTSPSRGMQHFYWREVLFISAILISASSEGKWAHEHEFITFLDT